MKEKIPLKEIENKMKPGKISLMGFLGNDKRNLEEILKNDNSTVKNMGLTHKDIAEKIIILNNAGNKGFGQPISVPPHFEVTVYSVRGGIPCPFGDPGIFPKTHITIKNLKQDTQITLSDLSIHMIYAHGFYEGKGSCYRLEPEKLVQILEI